MAETEKKRKRGGQPLLPDRDVNGRRIIQKGKPNAQKEAFAQAYIQTRSWRKAYILAYQPEHSNAITIKGHTYELRRDPWIQERISELDLELQEETRLSLAQLVHMLQEDRALAHREGQAAAAVQASMHIAKILGHYWERKQIVISDDFDAMGIAELRAFVTKKAQELGIATSEADGNGPLMIEHNSGEFEEEGEEEREEPN